MKRKRKSLEKLCAEKHFSRQEWYHAEFCGPCETICSFYKIFPIYTWRHRGYCECWVMAVFHGWQVRCLKNSVLSILLWKDQLKSSQGWLPLLTILCRGYLIVNLERNLIISIQFPALLFTSHTSPQTTPLTFTEEAKLKYSFISLDLRPWLKRVSVMMGISWLITVSLKAQN